MLTVALCKGKLIEPTLELFAKAGYGAARPAADSRRLLIPCPELGMTCLIVRPADVPTSGAHGAAVPRLIDLARELAGLGDEQPQAVQQPSRLAVDHVAERAARHQRFPRGSSSPLES